MISSARAKILGDQVVSSNAVNPSLKNWCFKILRGISPVYGVLPKSYFVAGGALSDTIPYAWGGPADIWKGDLVCAKAVRAQNAVSLGKIKQVGDNFSCNRCKNSPRPQSELQP